MDHFPDGREKRKGIRTPNEHQLEWRPSGVRGSRSGFLIETSQDGLAFGCRATTPPIIGSLLDLRVPDGWIHDDEECAVVRHASVAHEGLCIVGVEKYRRRPFPPAAEAATAISQVESKSRPLVTSEAFLRGKRVVVRSCRVAARAAIASGVALLHTLGGVRGLLSPNRTTAA